MRTQNNWPYSKLIPNSGNVLFTSILSIHDAGGVKRIRIYSRGDAIRTTPSYPENVTGFFFRNYTQEYELLDTSDGNKERN